MNFPTKPTVHVVRNLMCGGRQVGRPLLECFESSNPMSGESDSEGTLLELPLALHGGEERLLSIRGQLSRSSRGFSIATYLFLYVDQLSRLRLCETSCRDN